MVDSLLAKVDPTRVRRLDVHYTVRLPDARLRRCLRAAADRVRAGLQLRTASVDAMIGRAAHIKFLDSVQFAVQVALCLRDFFE